jgi:hypothetical protein
MLKTVGEYGNAHGPVEKSSRTQNRDHLDELRTSKIFGDCERLAIGWRCLRSLIPLLLATIPIEKAMMVSLPLGEFWVRRLIELLREEVFS